MSDAKHQLKQGGFDESTFSRLFEVEDRHFWFQARNVLITGIAKRILKHIQSPSILEIGCGNGNVLCALSRGFPVNRVIGLDFKTEALTFARRRCQLTLVQADAYRPPFSIQFDLVGMFDVLEHIADDTAALQNVHSLLPPTGKLLLTVPAHMSLWSYADVVAKHCRRYEQSELVDKISKAGFRVEFISPYMTILYPAMRLWRSVNANSAGNNTERFERDLRIVPGLNGIASWLMNQEARWIIAGHRLPFGASLVVVASPMK